MPLERNGKDLKALVRDADEGQERERLGYRMEMEGSWIECYGIRN